MAQIAQRGRAAVAGVGAPSGDQPCTRETVRCADARSYEQVLRPCCRGHIRQLVHEAVTQFEALGITYWADYGTLLGAVRNPLTTAADYPWLDATKMPSGPLQPGILPHDKDADFGVLWDDWPQLLRAAATLGRRGFDVSVRHHLASIKIRLSVSNQTNLDVFTWHPRPDGQLHRRRYISVDDFKGKAFPADWLQPMSRVDWEGLSLPAPADPAAFCAFRYGPNWRTPLPANHDGVRR